MLMIILLFFNDQKEFLLIKYSPYNKAIDNEPWNKRLYASRVKHKYKRLLFQDISTDLSDYN
jgi:hypothetical protein